MIIADWYGDAIAGSGNAQSEKRITCCGRLYCGTGDFVAAGVSVFMILVISPQSDFLLFFLGRGA